MCQFAYSDSSSSYQLPRFHRVAIETNASGGAILDKTLVRFQPADLPGRKRSINLLLTVGNWYVSPKGFRLTDVGGSRS